MRAVLDNPLSGVVSATQTLAIPSYRPRSAAAVASAAVTPPSRKRKYVAQPATLQSAAAPAPRGRAQPTRPRPSGVPVPNRGRTNTGTVYMDCTLCQAKFGQRTPVALTYLPTHLANFHPIPDGEIRTLEMRRPIALYRQSVRFAALNRKLADQLGPEATAALFGKCFLGQG